MFKKKEDQDLVQKEAESPKKIIDGKKIKDKVKKITQREIVFNRVLEIIKEKKLVVNENQPVMEVFVGDLSKLLYDRVCEDFTSGKAPLKLTPGNTEKLNDPRKLRVYVVGLCSNWLRRDPMLNGEVKLKV